MSKYQVGDVIYYYSGKQINYAHCKYILKSDDENYLTLEYGYDYNYSMYYLDNHYALLTSSLCPELPSD